MALAVAAAAGKTVCVTPFLVKRWELENSSDPAITLTHGEARSPDLLWVNSEGVAASCVGYAVGGRTTSATTCTIACEDDGNDDITIIAIWFEPGAGTAGLEDVS